jgi:hypothetical protein
MSLQAPEPLSLEVSNGPAPLRPPTEVLPPAATVERYKIAIRLTTGDLITAGETDGPDKAAALGHAVVADLTQENGEWPFFDGRFINPETIVSVDLLADA